jgi:hypothetical protein
LAIPASTTQAKPARDLDARTIIVTVDACIRQYRKQTPSAPVGEIAKMCSCGVDAARERKRRGRQVKGILLDKKEITVCVAFAKRHGGSSRGHASPFAKKLRRFSEELVSGFQRCVKATPRGFGAEKAFADYCVCVADTIRTKRARSAADRSANVTAAEQARCRRVAKLR